MIWLQLSEGRIISVNKSYMITNSTFKTLREKYGSHITHIQLERNFYKKYDWLLDHDKVGQRKKKWWSGWSRENSSLLLWNLNQKLLEFLSQIVTFIHQKRPW